MKSIWLSVTCLVVLFGIVEPSDGDLSVPDVTDVEEVTLFSLHTGWSARVRADGSAELSYGSTPVDVAKAPPQRILLATIYGALRPHAVESCVSDKCVSVSLRLKGKTSNVGFFVADTPTIRKIMEEVRAKSIPRDENRFRQLVDKYPMVAGESPAK